ncbi:MAG TPA: hypothetical protein VFY25_01400, partial [Anaerolineales bacterium]|nr:hypothetical protein [Anaerolineales bacterium]
GKSAVKPPGRKLGNQTPLIAGVLLLSLLLRWILIFRGGQYYISDETRYMASQEAARLILGGKFGQAFSQLATSPEHIGFKVMGIVPALLEHLTGPSLVMPAMFFSLFSVLNLFLIFLLARRVSRGDSNAPLYALVLAAACLSLLYYARHLFPYDLSMSFGLLAAYIGMAESQTVKHSLACGIFSFLCFVTYNGYWPLASFAMLVHLLTGDKTMTRMFQKAIFTGAGFVTPFVLLIGAGFLAGVDMVSAYRLFSQSITQGNFEEGWSLPFAYFWYIEHTIIIILGALALLAVLNIFKGAGRYTSLWLAGLLFVYVCLVVPSVFLHHFVVYGRLARQMMPFLILLSAEGLASLEQRVPLGKGIIGVIMAVIFVQAAWNFTESYNLAYPREFVAEAQARFPKFEFSSKRFAFGAPVICQNNGFLMENAKYYVDPPEEIPQVHGQLLMSALHPSNFRPYQYDGDPPTTRRAFDQLKLRMKFYKADQAFISEENSARRTIKNCMIGEK